VNGINSLAITITAGVLALASLVSVTVLLVSSIAVPSEIWAVLASSTGAAVLGGAVAQGASLASKDKAEE